MCACVCPSASVSVPSAKSLFFPLHSDARAAVWQDDSLYGERCIDARGWGRIVITPSHNVAN